MIKKIPKSIRNLVYPLLAISLLMLSWYILAMAVNKELLIPSPQATFQQLGKLLSEQSFYYAVWGTLLRSIVSFALSVAVAFLLAIFAALLPAFQKLLSPIVTVFRAVPTMSVILLSVIWLKPSFSPILVSFLIAFPMLYNGFYAAFCSVDKNLIEMSRGYKVSAKNQILYLYLPLVAPTVFSTLGATASFNVKIVISAEVLAGAAHSIGQMMQLDKIYLETASLLAWTLVAVLLSYAFEGLFLFVKICTVRWER